jgi:ABC-type Fe3+-siderophore transport system permease subunit
MGQFKKSILAILLTGIWLNISGTIRWIYLIEPHWIEKYNKLKIVFPAELINNITWMIWGFMFAVLIFILSRKFNLIQTALLSWTAAYVMMWVIVWNVGVLPTGMLWINIPLSFLDAFAGALICKKLSNK